MPKSITFNDIDIGHQYSVWQEVDEKGVTHVMASISATLKSAEGFTVTRSKTLELTGTAKTRAAALFGDLKTLALAEEGI